MSERSSGQSSRGDGGEIATSTLAEIYAQQGLIGRALSIYRRMLARAPGDSTIADRIRSLEVRMEEAGPEPQPPAPASPAERERLPWDPPEITGSPDSGDGPGRTGAGEAAAPDAPEPPSPTAPAPAETPRPPARMDGEAFRSWLNAR